MSLVFKMNQYEHFVNILCTCYDLLKHVLNDYSDLLSP